MIRRYRWQGNFTVSVLNDQLPAGVAATLSGTNPTYTDIELLPDPVSTPAQEDLDGYMATLGWVFDSTNPTVPLPTTSGQLFFGCESVASSDTVRYLPPGWDDNIATTIPYQIELTRGGTLRNLRIVQNSPDGNGNPVHYTVRINSANTLLVAILASTDTGGFNTADEVVVVAGDKMDIEITKPSGSLGNSAPEDVTATVEFC